MVFSSVLAYIQIGIFLLVVMTVSWLYATFFFASILCIMGPEKQSNGHSNQNDAHLMEQLNNQQRNHSKVNNRHLNKTEIVPQT